jgi:hypothetical protein
VALFPSNTGPRLLWLKSVLSKYQGSQNERLRFLWYFSH